LVIYVFAIIFTSTLGNREKWPLTPYCSWEASKGINHTEDEYDETEFGTGFTCLADGDYGPLAQDLFASMGDSFMTLFTRGVLADNLDETVVSIMEASLALMWLFIIFLIITFATLLNMLIGVVCEVISDAAKEEEEIEKVDGLKITILEAFDEIDTNDDGLVCQNEWRHIKDNPKVRHSLTKVGIEDERMEERLRMMEEMLFEEEVCEVSGLPERVGLTVEQLMQKIIEIRPDQGASALDLELLEAQVAKDQHLFKYKLKKVDEGIKRLLGPGADADSIGDMPNMPGMPGMPGEKEVEAQQTNNANTAMSNSRGGEIRLEDVSTRLLYEALEERSPEDNMIVAKLGPLNTMASMNCLDGNGGN